MNPLLRLFKTLYTKKRADNYEKARLARITRQLRQQFAGKKSEAEIQEYLTRLSLDELEALITNKKE